MPTGHRQGDRRRGARLGGADRLDPASRCRPVRAAFQPVARCCGAIGPGSNVAFAYLAYHGADTTVFTAAMVIDNFSTGFAGTALVAYMSSLTNIGYTATQYALLSSFYALLGKALKGLSGVAVEHLEVGRGLLEAYSLFFIGTALIGIPAFVLCLLLAVRKPAVAAAGVPGAVLHP
jgi:PAT family beta-lactamase induction signal transducer AmpG